MIEVENDCVGCPPELGCLGDICPYINVKHYYCDDCGQEEQLYYYDGEELCIYCIEKRLEKVI